MSFDQMLEQLRVEYVQKLPQKIEDIRKSLKENQVASIREDFHKLKGTGKTYGIPEISELSELMEGLCETHASQLPEIVPEAVSILEEIHELRQHSKAFCLAEDARWARLRGFANLQN